MKDKCKRKSRRNPEEELGTAELQKQVLRG